MVLTETRSHGEHIGSRKLDSQVKIKAFRGEPVPVVLRDVPDSYYPVRFDAVSKLNGKLLKSKEDLYNSYEAFDDAKIVEDGLAWGKETFGQKSA
ncbi:MAG TPA: hypothetical protein VFA93_03045 [Patescibacteria group bacterium]|nr:hypothetical protein [Patescibacteria group bacterium]